MPREAPGPARPRVVVVADDEEDVREMIREILKYAGLRSIAVRDGREALVAIRRLSGRVDLVLTDVMMPELDGPTLARRLAEDWPRIPVLFMTGYMAEALASQGLLAESVPRIEKPFQVRDLIAKVRAALGIPPA